MKKFLASMTVLVLPVFALAQTVNDSYFTDLLNKFRGILNTIVLILIALAVVYFIWNVFKYIQAGDSAKKEEAAKSMLFGIIGLAVIVSVWGLVALLQSTFGISTRDAGNVNNLLPR
jgi:NADH:ubiquinone oxidoreductase subunit 2 (subunit N)